MKLVKLIIIMMFTFGIFYTLGSFFYSASFNIKMCSENARWGIAYFGGIASLLAGIITIFR